MCRIGTVINSVQSSLFEDSVQYAIHKYLLEHKDFLVVTSATIVGPGFTIQVTNFVKNRSDSDPPKKGE